MKGLSINEVLTMISPAPHLRSIMDSDGAAILDIERGALTRLNSTGSYVWERLLRGEPVSQVVLSLAAETNTDVTIVQRDMDVFIEQITAQHLLDV
jgi:Coenzyme PQQ synthesis protein D (PqqD)